MIACRKAVLPLRQSQRRIKAFFKLLLPVVRASREIFVQTGFAVLLWIWGTVVQNLMEARPGSNSVWHLGTMPCGCDGTPAGKTSCWPQEPWFRPLPSGLCVVAALRAGWWIQNTRWRLETRQWSGDFAVALVLCACVCLGDVSFLTSWRASFNFANIYYYYRQHHGYHFSNNISHNSPHNRLRIFFPYISDRSKSA